MFRLQFHSLLLARCPKVLDEMKLSVSQHVCRLVCRLQTCLLDSRLAGFAPATLALATLSLDLELFVGWHLWLPATVTLQTLAQVCSSVITCCFTILLLLLLLFFFSKVALTRKHSAPLRIFVFSFWLSVGITVVNKECCKNFFIQMMICSVVLWATLQNLFLSIQVIWWTDRGENNLLPSADVIICFYCNWCILRHSLKCMSV